MRDTQREGTGRRSKAEDKKTPYRGRQIVGRFLEEIRKQAGKGLYDFAQDLGIKEYELYDLQRSLKPLPEKILSRLYGRYSEELNEAMYGERVRFYESLPSFRTPEDMWEAKAAVQHIRNDDAIKDSDIGVAIELGVRGKINRQELVLRGQRGDFRQIKYDGHETLVKYKSVEGTTIRVDHGSYLNYAYKDDLRTFLLVAALRVYESGRLIREYCSTELPSDWLPLIYPHLTELAETGADSEDILAALDTLCQTISSEESRNLDDLSRIEEIKLVEDARSAMVLEKIEPYHLDPKIGGYSIKRILKLQERERKARFTEHRSNELHQ